MKIINLKDIILVGIAEKLAVNIFSMHIFMFCQDMKVNLWREKELDICLRGIKTKEKLINLIEVCLLSVMMRCVVDIFSVLA